MNTPTQRADVGHDSWADFRADPPEPGANLLERVTHFLISEADLLDGWRLREWLDLLDVTVSYEVPATDDPTAPLSGALGLIHDDRARLQSRVDRLLSRRAHREFPSSRVRRLVSNIRVQAGDDGRHLVMANFCLWRVRERRTDLFLGHYRYELREVADPPAFLICRKRVELDQESLDPHGTVSVIL